MNWYITKIIFRIVCGEGNHTAQFDEQLRLFKASSAEEAFLKAQILGSREEDTFYNQQQELVKWQFINVSEVVLLPNINDGAMLYSFTAEKENGVLYEQLIRDKALQIETGYLTEIA
ncbi:MAG: DUF4288 domain-containing protein [Bacteroidetes bacterium]|nr:DUF4288 domain-containing protein [Bacteroidota bacterium]